MTTTRVSWERVRARAPRPREGVGRVNLLHIMGTMRYALETLYTPHDPEGRRIPLRCVCCACLFRSCRGKVQDLSGMFVTERLQFSFLPGV